MRIAALIACLALSACVLSPERVGTGRLAPGDAITLGLFSPGGATLTVASGLREIEGRVAVCGTWSGDGPAAHDYARRVLEAGIVSAGGRRLSQNLSYMSRAARRPVPGDSAGCTLTAVPRSAEAAAAQVEIRLPRIIVERDCDDLGGCNITRFRQIAPSGPL